MCTNNNMICNFIQIVRWQRRDNGYQNLPCNPTNEPNTIKIFSKAFQLVEIWIGIDCNTYVWHHLCWQNCPQWKCFFKPYNSSHGWGFCGLGVLNFNTIGNFKTKVFLMVLINFYSTFQYIHIYSHTHNHKYIK